MNILESETYTSLVIVVTSADFDTIVALLTLSGSTLSAEELIELIDSNLVVAIEGYDDDTNFYIATASITETEPATIKKKDDDEDDTYTTFITIGAVFGSLFVVVAGWTLFDAKCRKKNKGASNGGLGKIDARNARLVSVNSVTQSAAGSGFATPIPDGTSMGTGQGNVDLLETDMVSGTTGANNTNNFDPAPLATSNNVANMELPAQPMVSDGAGAVTAGGPGIAAEPDIPIEPAIAANLPPQPAVAENMETHGAGGSLGGEA